MGRVIINGDDFGMNKRCTLAIAQAFGEGLITDTTIMANGELFDYALSLARQQGFSDRITFQPHRGHASHAGDHERCGFCERRMLP